MKILIVEDDPDSRIYVERALTSQGYSVESADNGVKALEKAERSPPDLIISDIMMPEMDGFELCRKVKSNERLRAVPFVFYTATYIEHKDETLAMALGASRFLIKPMEPDDFFRAIRAVVEEPRRRSAEVPLQPVAEVEELNRMQLEVLARKLDKKVRELDEEHEALRRSEHLLSGQKRVLEMIAGGAPLEDTLAALIHFLESGSEGIFGSILLLDEDGVHVRHGAAPSLPDAYIRAVDGAAIGPRAGSCGTAMFRREPVIVTDILSDPLWEEYRHLLVPHGFVACWSTPILSPSGRVLGSFAMYYRETRSPTPAEKELVNIATHLAGIAIEHHRGAEELRRAAVAAEAGSRAKSQFLANMSHEMRTPLTAVLGFVDLLQEMEKDDEKRSLLSGVKSSGQALLLLISDLLDFTRIERGELPLAEKEISVKECVEFAVRIVIPEARKKKLDINLQFDQRVPAAVIADDARLRQVLVKLLGNAVKFTEQGGVDITVTRRRDHTTDGTDALFFVVRDSGIGIPQEKMGTIFERFEQVNGSLTRPYGGTGLGLTLSKGIVEKMGGRIGVQSRIGEGSTFSFWIPLQLPGAERDEK